MIRRPQKTSLVDYEYAVRKPIATGAAALYTDAALRRELTGG